MQHVALSFKEIPFDRPEKQSHFKASGKLSFSFRLLIYFNHKRGDTFADSMSIKRNPEQAENISQNTAKIKTVEQTCKKKIVGIIFKTSGIYHSAVFLKTMFTSRIILISIVFKNVKKKKKCDTQIYLKNYHLVEQNPAQVRCLNCLCGLLVEDKFTHLSLFSYRRNVQAEILFYRSIRGKCSDQLHS